MSLPGPHSWKKKRGGDSFWNSHLTYSFCYSVGHYKTAVVPNHLRSVRALLLPLPAKPPKPPSPPPRRQKVLIKGHFVKFLQSWTHGPLTVALLHHSSRASHISLWPRLRFHFLNLGVEKELIVGFPVWPQGGFLFVEKNTQHHSDLSKVCSATRRKLNKLSKTSTSFFFTFSSCVIHAISKRFLPRLFLLRYLISQKVCIQLMNLHVFIPQLNQ